MSARLFNMQVINPLNVEEGAEDAGRFTWQDAAVFLCALERKGIRLQQQNGELRHTAPSAALSPQDASALRLHKQELIQFLAQLEGGARKIPPLTPQPRPAAIPVSFAQERLWLLEQMGLGGSAYNLSLTLTLQGPLDLDALHRTLEELLRRHESLRTRFESHNGVPCQVIDAPSCPALTVTDVATLRDEQGEAPLREWLRQEMNTPFDLARGPLLRVRLLRLSEAQHLLLATLHHIIADGWSMGIMASEISALYNAYAQVQPLRLAELPVQYADYALWQRQWLQGEVLERQLEYWRRKLAGATPLLALPTDRPRPALPSFKGRSHNFMLSQKLSRDLVSLGRRVAATPFMVLLAGFQLLLSRYSGQEDISVGCLAAGRPNAQTQGVLGFFVNTLVLRADLTGNLSFLELLQQVKETALGAQAHQDIPFEKMVMELQPSRELSYQPLFQVMFIFQNTPPQRLEAGQGRVGTLGGGGRLTAKFDLTLQMMATADGLAGAFEYATDLFDDTTIRRWAKQFTILLENIVADPQRRCTALPLLAPDERRELLAHGNDTAAHYPSAQGIHELFSQQARKTPHELALISDRGRVTYRELEERSNRLAHYLRSLGVRADQQVGVCAERSSELVVTILGILKAGAAYLPLDPAHPAKRLGLMLEQSQVRVVLLQERWREHLPAHPARQVLLKTDWPLIERCPATSPSAAVWPQSLAYVIYTSGSTGSPKAVAATHAAVVNRIWTQRQIAPLKRGDVCCQKTAIGFVDAVVETLGPLLQGLTLAVISDHAGRDTEALLTRIKYYGVTYLVTVPSLASALLASPRAQRCLQGLRHWVLSGENFPLELCAQLRQRLPRCRFVNVYGCSEVGADVTRHVCEECDGPAVPIGRPIANLRAYVLDEELEPMPVGVPGELGICGVGLARGYLHDPQLSATRFIAAPFGAPGERLFRTGDIVRRQSDGSLVFVGRGDEQTKIRGARIEPAEVEAALLRHPEVRQAAVIAGDDAAGNRRLVSYIVARDPPPTQDQLRQHLRGLLPQYMVPAVFTVLERLPLTASGKIDRRALGALEVTARSEERYIAPRTASEKTLAQIWCQALGLEKVGIQDNFFDLGGHSLLAVRVVSQMRELFGIELKLRELFERPSIMQLAQRTDELLRACGRGASLPVLRPRPTDGPTPLSFRQHGLWCLERKSNSAANNRVVTLELMGRVRSDVLERTLRVLTDRHEILRTRFALEDATPVQVLAPLPTAALLELQDLSCLESNLKRARFAHLLAQECAKPFDLSAGPLMRSVLFKLSDEESTLAVIVHPIVCDRRSLEILAQEIVVFYAATTKHRPDPLPAPLLQYGDYAAWERGWLKGEALQAQLQYWREQTRTAAQLLLPTDRPRPGTLALKFATLDLKLDAQLARTLLLQARLAQATPYALLLSAFQLLLAQCSGLERFWLGLPLLDRAHWQTASLLGPFEKTLALRADVAGQPSLTDFLKSVQRSLEAAAAQQLIAVEDIPAQSREPIDVPLLRVGFAWQPVAEPEPPDPPLRSEPVLRHDATPFELCLCMRETEGRGLQGAFEYACELFDAASIEKWRVDFVRLLLQLARADLTNPAPTHNG